MTPGLDSAYYRTFCGGLHVKDALIIILCIQFLNVITSFGNYFTRLHTDPPETLQHRLAFSVFLFSIFSAAVYARKFKSAGGLVPLLIISAFVVGVVIASTIIVCVSMFFDVPNYPMEIKALMTVFLALVSVVAYWQLSVVHRAFRYYKELAIQPILLTTISPMLHRAPPPEYDNLVNDELEKKIPLA